MELGIFCDVYEEYMNKNTYLGAVIPLAGINAPIRLKEYIKPYILRFFEVNKIAEGFFVIAIKYEKKAFMLECLLKDGIIAKMEIF
ncbi:hypothetical protein [Helicobacter cappadocius]|uniref:Uncharacterized protein n=1 Tax=Helicobacter cappadocius TaxID=3063998 RepID=A0AA90PJ87_9HELI|nr:MULTISPECIES: hypothetical protein [unclassified Helicobacter]MDO7252788.1 hypothetical protein [Helicobacter sp. faydin-H75]MDP2538831.1 hypothetical protein [Helicobacter sp. faydin-H76]